MTEPGHAFSACQKTVSLRASVHTGVAIRFPCLPLGEGGSRVSRKRETDEGKKARCENLCV